MRESYCFWEGFWFWKVLWMKRGGIKFFRLNFLVSQCRKISWASLQCFRKLGVSKKFLHDRGYHIFPSKIFGLTEPNFFIGEHCAVSEKLCYRKFSCIGGEASRLCRIFLSHRTETTIFVKEAFCFPENFWYRKKNMEKRWHITIFSRNYYVSYCRNISSGNPTVFEKISGFEKFCGWKRGYHVFASKVIGLTVPKNSWASLQCFRKFGESKNFLHDRGYHIFPSKIFGLTEPKYFIGEHCAVSEKLFYWKFSCIGGGASRFCRIILSHRTETTIFVK